eukprot:7904615-Alexandrium_andersonii.AAC.1
MVFHLRYWLRRIFFKPAEAHPTDSSGTFPSRMRVRAPRGRGRDARLRANGCRSSRYLVDGFDIHRSCSFKVPSQFHIDSP